MATQSTAIAKPNGLKTVVDTIIAPKEAFEALRVAPTWVAAMVILLVLYVIGQFLAHDAAVHAGVVATQHMTAPGGLLANASDDQKRKAIDSAMHPPMWQNLLSLVAVFVVLAINAALLMIAKAAGKGDRGFGTLWAASVNIAVPTQGLAQVIIGIIARVRGADSFNATMDLYRVLPGLGYLGLNGYLGAFLTYISVFSIWGLVLTALMLQTTVHVKGPVAWIIPTVIMLLGASFIGLFGLLPQ